LSFPPPKAGDPSDKKFSAGSIGQVKLKLDTPENLSQFDFFSVLSQNFLDLEKDRIILFLGESVSSGAMYLEAEGEAFHYYSGAG
jgi:hypothetical protein